MAELYQSEWNEIKQRQSVGDLQMLIQLLDSDGTLTIEEDPSEDEILAAREKAAKDAEKQQAEAEKEAEKAQAEADKEAEAQAEADQTARIAAMPIEEDQKMDDITENPPVGSDVAQSEEVEDSRKKAGSKK